MKTKMNSFFRLLILLPMFLISITVLISCSNTENKKVESSLPTEVVTDSVYVNVDEMPVFTGGDEGLLKYIADNTMYPKDAMEKNIQGKVIVRFVIEKDGTISNMVVIKSIDPSLDAAAVKVVGFLPKFERPGKVGGLPVRVYYMVPITFTLK